MHAQTPHLTVSDPRGLAVRSVDYCRVMPGAAAELRINHSRFDARGRLLEQHDPRLWASAPAPANLTTVHSLSGQVLSSGGVDNGWRCSLPGEAGQVVRQWDGRGSQRRVEYDALLRPVAVFEQLAEQPVLCSERLTYADGSDEHRLHNRCGRLLRHDDPAATRCWPDYSLTGETSTEQRHFLASPDWPDWPVDIDARDALLEPGEGASSGWRHGPLGQVLEQTDAGGHRQSFHSNLSGELQQVRLQLADQPVQTLLRHARYNAMAQMLEETLGNGVTTQRRYREEDGRLLGLSARRETGETLQDIHYAYDPAGNVIQVEDRAQPTRHFANQRIEPRCEYRYDSLYQLIEATGWEAGTARQGPGMLSDPQARSNYRQTYRYDAGGNLLELSHVGAQSQGRTLVAAHHSNRCLEAFDERPPSDDDFLDYFDANGNRLELQKGRRLHWDVRNQLSEVRPVTREDDADDTERYHYDAAGQRVRKLHSAQAAGRNLHSEVRYLPGLELHENSATGESLQVINVQAGTCGVRVLHWLNGRPDEIAQDQQRYGLTDHLGSSTLELDEAAVLISHEVYYPFGATAWSAGRSEVQAGYKTIRYSGKERDASGLYYYGARYYMPWLQRWLNPDPAGAVDGLNLYRMVRNSPLTHIDLTGRNSERAQQRWRTAFNFHRKAIASVAPGIVKVHLSGDRSVFESAGFPTDDSFPAHRSLTWLSIESGYKGKVAGVNRALISLQSITGRQVNGVAKTEDASHTAFINGGFFNCQRATDPRLPQSSPIGTAVIEGKVIRSVAVPEVHARDYHKLLMADLSHIHSAPMLANQGIATFTREHLKHPRFTFDDRSNVPGYLVHADQRNTRSAISQPAAGTGGRTRLVVGPSEGRGPQGTGYTMAEWADVLARIDRMNAAPGRSLNLDGGSSSVLGVVNRAGEVLLRYGAYSDPGRNIGNFLAFARRN